MADEPFTADDVDMAAKAIAVRTRYSQHGQLCPVWRHRPKGVRPGDDRTPTEVELASCNCWIMSNARRDATLALEALTAAGWEARCDCSAVVHDLPILRSRLRGEPGCEADHGG
jgi:hypothetical protein